MGLSCSEAGEHTASSEHRSHLGNAGCCGPYRVFHTHRAVSNSYSQQIPFILEYSLLESFSDVALKSSMES